PGRSGSGRGQFLEFGDEGGGRRTLGQLPAQAFGGRPVGPVGQQRRHGGADGGRVRVVAGQVDRGSGRGGTRPGRRLLRGEGGDELRDPGPERGEGGAAAAVVHHGVAVRKQGLDGQAWDDADVGREFPEKGGVVLGGGDHYLAVDVS